MAALHSIGPITHYLQFLPRAFPPEKLKDSPPRCVNGAKERKDLGQESKNDCFLNLHAVSTYVLQKIRMGVMGASLRPILSLCDVSNRKIDSIAELM